MSSADRFMFEGETYEVGHLMLSEARAIQKAIGFTIGEFEERLNKGDVECIAALIWIVQKRRDPTLRFDDVDGDLSTFEPLDSDDEDETSNTTEGKDQPVEPVTAGTLDAVV